MALTSNSHLFQLRHLVPPLSRFTSVKSLSFIINPRVRHVLNHSTAIAALCLHRLLSRKFSFSTFG